MSKQIKTAPILGDDMLEYLDSYSDFTFELLALKTLRDHGLECDHGGSYVDPVTKKTREFDIRALKTIGKYRVRMAIECKNIRDFAPILVTCVPRHSSESSHHIAALSNTIMDFARAEVLAINGESSLYKPDEAVGKNITQVTRNTSGIVSGNDAELYDKWGQCLSSADDLIAQLHSTDPVNVEYSMVLPVVVVPDGRLWVVNYDQDGSRLDDPSPTDRCSFYVNKTYRINSAAQTRMDLTHVEFFTLTGLSDFVKQTLMHLSDIEKIFPPDAITASPRSPLWGLLKKDSKSPLGNL